MTPGRRVFLLVLMMCSLALSVGIHSPTRAQESCTCPSGKSSCYQSGYAGLTEEQEHGRDTWYFGTGGDLATSGKRAVGDQALWRILAIQSHGTFDLLQAADSRFR